MRPLEYQFVTLSQSFKARSLVMMLVYSGMVKFKAISVFILLQIKKLKKLLARKCLKI